MKYIIVANLYWPIWLVFAAFGHTWLGMLIGAVVVIALQRLFWVRDFPKKQDKKEGV